MGTWNYRLCKEIVREYDDEPVVYYSLREAYYNDNEEIWGITENAVGIGFDKYSFEDFDPIEVATTSIERMKQALERPIVDLDTIVYAQQTHIDEDDAEAIEIIDDSELDNE